MMIRMSSFPPDRTPEDTRGYLGAHGRSGNPREIRDRLLASAVDENLEALHNEPRGSRRRSRELSARRRRRFLGVFSALAAATAAGAVLLVASGPERPVASAPQAAAAAPDPASPADLPLELRLARHLEHGRPAQILAEAVPLDVRRVAIDAGHGGIDTGTSPGDGLHEKDLTRDIALRVAGILADRGVETVLTRREDEQVSLRRRAEIANRARADLFLSIHVNWLPDRSARGVEVYFLGPTDDPFLSRLAAAENQASGYTVADTRQLLEGILADVRQDQSQRLARALSEALYTNLRRDNPDIVARGVMSAPFVVLVATDMPAVLAEVACLSNDREARLLARPGYRQRIAAALADGLVRYAVDTAGQPEGAGS
jgi:N-acetylmuramoyl-L-alanine amidase